MNEIGFAELPESQPPRSWLPSGWWWLTGGLMGGVLLAILAPNYMRTCCRGSLTACKSNCRNIATALERYAKDNEGHYPPSLETLTYPSRGANLRYLAKLPTCPAAGRMTYRNYRRTTSPDSFSFSCCGNNHGQAYTGYPADSSYYPQYDAEHGLLDHP